MDVDVWVMQLDRAAARVARDRIAAAQPGWRASFSDSDGVAVVALAQGRRIGVDVERVRDRARIDAVAARVFGPVERARIATATGRDRLTCFYRCWTAAEASAKARGEGLPALLGEPAQPSLPVTWFEPVPGYVAAVATDGEAPRLRRREHR